MKKEYLKLLKDITETETLEQLKGVVSEINSFVKENKLKTSSEEFQKLEKFVKIMLIKHKSNKKLQPESRQPWAIVISEEQYNRLFG